MDFTDKQKQCIDYFKENLPTWLEDDLKLGKFVVICGGGIKGIFDSFENAIDYAYNNLELGSYIIQEIYDESKITSFLSLAVIE